MCGNEGRKGGVYVKRLACSLSVKRRKALCYFCTDSGSCQADTGFFFNYLPGVSDFSRCCSYGNSLRLLPRGPRHGGVRFTSVTRSVGFFNFGSYRLASSNRTGQDLIMRFDKTALLERGEKAVLRTARSLELATAVRDAVADRCHLTWEPASSGCSP